MDYCTIKDKSNQQYGNCLLIAKKYEKQLYSKGKSDNIILDDVRNKVIEIDTIEYSLTPELYLDLLDDLLNYREELRNNI